MTYDTPARTKLIKWLTGDGRNQATLARSVGVSAPAVFAWVKGQYRPTQLVRESIEELTGIVAGDWYLPEERAEFKATMARIRKGA